MKLYKMNDKVIAIIFSIIIIIGFVFCIIRGNSYKSNAPNYYNYETMGEFSEKT